MMRHPGRFGIYRWFLATMVSIAHLAPVELSGCGYYAVFGFFALSGYLMTLMLQEEYLHLPNGVRRYFLNRALRIYPLYWLVGAVAFVLVFAFPDVTAAVHPRMMMPGNILAWIHNIIIFGIVYPYGVRIDSIFIPPAWSLSTELTFYLFLPFVIRNRFMFNWWVIFSVLFWLTFIFDHPNPALWYYSLLGGSMPFAVGSAMYFVKDKWPPLPRWIAFPVILLAVICNFSIFPLLPVTPELWVLIIFILNVIIIYYLSRIPRWPLDFLDRLDAALGGMAYSIFLVHIVVGVVVKLVLKDAVEVKTLPFFFICFPFVNTAAYLLYAYVEPGINRLRARVKTGQRL